LHSFSKSHAKGGKLNDFLFILCPIIIPKRREGYQILRIIRQLFVPGRTNFVKINRNVVERAFYGCKHIIFLLYGCLMMLKKD
jgi:hypothetical protein